jgi:microcystin-dependent protein
MAQVPESELFAETVDFIAVDINEPVLGGLSPEGPINRIARILGSRTLWLRAQLLLVQFQGLRFGNVFKITANYSVLQADAGKLCIFEGGIPLSNQTVTLPNSNNPALAFTVGQTITIKNNNQLYNINVVRHPSATSDALDNGSTGLVLKRGDTVTLTYDGSNKWYVTYRTRTKDEIGFIKYSASANVPEGYLLCNGAAVSRSTYMALFQEIGVTYGAGDGTTTFNLPELRGEFIRALDNGRGVDTGRTLGSAQVDMLESHTHEVDGAVNVSTSGSGTDILVPGGGTPYTITATGGAETRPRNVALNAFIYHGKI